MLTPHVNSDSLLPRKAITTFIFSLIIFSLAKTASAADWLYTIRPGDNLWTLCQEYTKKKNCWQDIAPLNNIDRTRQIPPGTVIRFPVSWLKTPPETVSIVFSHGEVNYQVPGEEVSPASAGVKLPIGSQLTTKKGTVKLLFADGSSMILEPDSHLQLDTLSSFGSTGMIDSSVRLSNGTVKTHVIKREPRSQFRTITPSAVAAVRGTEYRVSSMHANNTNDRKMTTLVEVYEGLVDVNAENTSRLVPAGYGVVTLFGQAPQAPITLLKKPVFLAFSENQFLPASIQWQTLNAAKAYQLDIFADQRSDKKTDVLIEQHKIYETTLTLSRLKPGCYQLSLRGIDTEGLQGHAEKNRLCLAERIDIPALEKASIEYTENNHAKITWADTVGAKRYRIEVSGNSNFKSIQETIETTDASYFIESNAVLFIRVQALGKNNEHTPFSQTLRWEPRENYWLALIPIGLFFLAML